MQALKHRSSSTEEAKSAEERARSEWQNQTTYPIIVFGSVGSPYTRKVLSALRFQRVPCAFISRRSRADVGFPMPPGPTLLPSVVFVKDWQPMGDSTFILREVERRGLSGKDRSLVPPRPALALLANLLEDFADEVSGIGDVR